MDVNKKKEPAKSCYEIRTASHSKEQEETAERCGLHRTYYSGVERGVRNLSLVNIEKIAKGLRISLRNLFGRV